MAYLHEMALKNAVKKLYMFGSSDRPKLKTSFDDIGNGIGNVASSAIQSQAAQKLKAQQAAEGRQKEALARRDAMQEGDQRYQEFREKNFDHVSPEAGQNMLSSFTGGPRIAVDQDGQAEAQDVLKRIGANQEAQETRMGGTYTPQGLQAADARATANAQDLLRMRSMIGIGGTQRGY